MINFPAPHKHLIILGPQASGKGTQAEMLAEEFGFKHISMGEKLREEVASGSKLGQTLKGFMDRGELVPDEYTLKIALREIQNSPDGFILDGFPRNTVQSKFLDEHTRIDKVIVLDLNDKIAIERITGRRECQKGHTYHILYNKPKKEGICDEDNLPLRQRSDDTAPAVLKRLALFHQITAPVIEHYKGKVIHIDGTPSIPDVHKAVLKVVHQK